MKASRTLLRLGCATVFGLAIVAIPTSQESASGGMLAQGQAGSVELEDFLFVQAPEPDFGAHAGGNPGGHVGGNPIIVVWLPQPLQRLCLGKTSKQCSTIDYCIRTTNRDSSQCKNIGVNLAHIPPYPPNTRPRRMHSVVFSYLSPTKFKVLQDFYKSAPKASLERFTMSARVKARIRYTNKPDDDDLEVLDVIAAPPF
jgi:hypothetical protein